MVEVMKKISTGLIIGLFILGALGIVFTITSSNVSAFTPHEPIKIDSNIDFLNQGWPGNGTEMNPWVIEGLEINGTGYLYCIFISNTTEHFTIKDCYLHNSDSYGILISNAIVGEIINNNVCLNGEYGIQVYRYSSNIIISNNTVNYNDRGGIIAVACNRAKGNIIQNNEVSHNNGSGIAVLESPVHIVSNNTVSNNTYGIHFRSSPYSNIINNTMSNNSIAGMRILSSSNTVISNNTFISNSQYDIESVLNTNLSMSGNTFEIGISVDGEEPYIPGNDVDNVEETPGFGFELIFIASIIGIIVFKKRK